MSQRPTIKKAFQTCVDLIGQSPTEIILRHLELDRGICLDDCSPENIERIDSALQELLGEGAAVLMARIYAEFSKVKEKEHISNPGGQQNIRMHAKLDNNGEKGMSLDTDVQNFAQAVESTLVLLGEAAKRAVLSELEHKHKINIYNGSAPVLLPKLEQALAEIFSPAVAVLLVKEISYKVQAIDK